MPRPLARALVLFVSLSSSALAHDDALFRSQTQAPYPGSIVVVPGTAPSIDFPRQGVSLLGWLPLEEFGVHTSGADCWGYVAPSGREYAIIGLSDGVGFVEVTDPGRPTIVSVLPAVGSLWRDVKVYQDHAYIVSEGGDGIVIVDLSQIDAGTVTLVGNVTTGGQTATHNVAIDEASGFLYRTGGASDTLGIRVYSLANKSNPTFVAQWNNRYFHDAQVVTYTSGPYAGKQVCFAFSENGSGGGSPRLEILDVTQKTNIQLLGSVAYSNGSFSHQGWLTPDRQHLYLNDELDEAFSGTPTTTRILDVSNLSAPFEVGTFTNGSSAIDHNLYTLGDEIYEANYRSGLRVYDASNPTAPVEKAFFDTYPDDDAPEFNGLWNAYPFLPSGTVFGSDLEKGLFVWRMGDPLLAFSFPVPLTELVAPSGQTVQVQITESTPGAFVPGTATLHADSGSGFVAIPMTSLGGGLFSASLPATTCGDRIEYYFSAETTGGVTWTEPAAAPTFRYGAIAAYGTVTLQSLDFENAAGWTVGAPGDDATTGIWTRVDPIGTSAQPEDDHTASGTTCWVTGQGPPGGGVGDNDVDGGRTTLTSSVIDLSGGDAVISYWRWYSNVGGGDPGNDVFTVDVTNNGSSWQNVEVVGPTGNDSVGGWRFHEFRVSDFVPPTATVQVRFVAADENSGSIVEAAIDDFEVARYDCAPPCPPPFAYGAGELGSSGFVGTTGWSGTPSVATADFAIEASGFTPNSFAVLFTGTGQTSAPSGGFTVLVGGVLTRTVFFTDANG
ncbi:MAG: choice-of-anchor B family protein, partial [Planctomycetota bacterium JB042]